MGGHVGMHAGTPIDSSRLPPAENTKALYQYSACTSRAHMRFSHHIGTQDVRIAFIAAGSAACHCLAGGVDGRLYTWGRNEVCFVADHLCLPLSSGYSTMV